MMVVAGEFLSAAYPWTKALHVISVIAWMAGLLYLPRLFVYHVERAGKAGELRDTFKVMERKLLKLIMNPASIAAWVFGLMLVVTPGIIDWSEPWVHVKATLVIAMTGYHHLLVRWWKDFAEDRNQRSGRFYRIANEVPALIMVAIVVMVIVRPF
ncbi:MAG TPA: protoporphyrinogen oxidase HemJ [Thermohalobaculum sp.]|nr:protoporphyrinogen oxidase HemJ [Thermohalobaculum sp.]